MGGKSRKTGQVSRALIERLKKGNTADLMRDGKRQECAIKKRCGSRKKEKKQNEKSIDTGFNILSNVTEVSNTSKFLDE